MIDITKFLTESLITKQESNDSDILDIKEGAEIVHDNINCTIVSISEGVYKLDADGETYTVTEQEFKDGLLQ